MRNRLLTAALAAACLAGSVAASAASPNPFPLLENEIRAEIQSLRTGIERVPGGGSTAELQNRLTQAYMNLHDIRNHEAFLELWNRWGFNRPALDLLYVGSGSHVAPLVFFYGERPPREITMTYTEVDPWSAPRLEQILRRMESMKAIGGLEITYEPGGHPAYQEAWRSALTRKGGEGLRSNRESFFNWFRSTGAQVGEPAGFRVLFRFDAGAGHASIRLLVGDDGGGPGSTYYYRGEDLAKCDLFVTHSWRSSPDENLRLLYDAIESSKVLRKGTPPAVMMEDLRRYPYPVDLGFFDPVAETRKPYGHLEFVRMPDGTKTTAQDGAPLYGGGVILQPDGRWLCGLSESQREALFDFLLFSPSPYGRSNVDIFKGELRTAPPLLDLAVGYGLKSIEGKDIRRDKGFSARLAASALGLLESPGGIPERFRKNWCGLLRNYEAALKTIRDRDLDAYFRDAERLLTTNPFLADPKIRGKYEQALKERDLYTIGLGDQAREAAEALTLFDENRPRFDAACSTAP